jgi:hypothetical protein
MVKTSPFFWNLKIELYHLRYSRVEHLFALVFANRLKNYRVAYARPAAGYA